MPYASIHDLPPPRRAHLPPHAQEIYVGAFNGAWEQYAWKGPQMCEKTADRVNSTAVKRKYVRVGDSWVARASG